ncbi:dTDP-4-dehydrorhamnose reductase [Gracilibacillus halotolerans]|uniref:dTDP-4-dehydrorhamnose reductase n=1 Tax=Gracilibacillus halotolerans TaxID=74386 RepID=A0A841RQE0_9BACI|nr:dTDP-4-dehydrorhamnose reductase [Gracilibacillus halotolerans]MBB6512858.1 dTDP-4-dehydrorhamnose reductase [Gracilibacillus halotolerans]
MKVLVTGYSGQLGYDVVRVGLNSNHEIVGISSKDLNITNKSHVEDFIRKLKPDVIIHCAAYTAVDNAEDNKSDCYNVNVNGTKYLAEIAKTINAKFVYISTDYVFNGEGNLPFTETSVPNPINYYGETKYEGEQIVKGLIEKHFIIRISWVFGINGNNFVKTMIRLSETKNELNIVNDQIGSPTYTYDLAHLIIDMIDTEKYGTYHASNEGYCSWAELALETFKMLKKEVKVNLVSTEEYPTRALRPKNSRLSKSKLIKSGFAPLPDWESALKRYIIEFNRGG